MMSFLVIFIFSVQRISSLMNLLIGLTYAHLAFTIVIFHLGLYLHFTLYHTLSTCNIRPLGF